MEKTRRERRAVRRRLRKAGAAFAVVTALGVTGAVGGSAYASHSGSNQGCSNGECHLNGSNSGNGTFHSLGSQGTEHCFVTLPGAGRNECS
jgi:hypothetical protein